MKIADFMSRSLEEASSPIDGLHWARRPPPHVVAQSNSVGRGGRITAAIVEPNHARLELHVDDTLLATRGPRNVAILEARLVALWLQIVGMPFAWHQADTGTSVDWIGATISITEGREWIQVRLQDKKRVELMEELRAMLQRPTMERRTLGEIRRGVVTRGEPSKKQADI